MALNHSKNSHKGVCGVIAPRAFSQDPDTRLFRESVTRINAEIETQVASSLLNERTIENWLKAIQDLENDHPAYWLLLVRLAEAAVLCAGNYVDSCQFEAVGDLLVNPREIIVYSLADGSSRAKNRHGRLSEQFAIDGLRRGDWMKQFSTGMFLQTTKLPLLPYLTQILSNSDRISASYISQLEERQRRIVETLTYLAAWHIPDSADLRRRLHDSSEREFVESNLCRFDAQIFDRIGICLEQSLEDPDYQSPFLALTQWSGNTQFTENYA